MTEIYRKNLHVKTEAEAKALLAEMDSFSKNPVIGNPQPILDAHLMKIWNDGSHLSWEWSDETRQEYDQRISAETISSAQLVFYENPGNLEAWKDEKIRPWRDQKLVEWIDYPRLKDLLYDFDNWTQAQIDERAAMHRTLCDWPDTFTEYVDDAAIEEAKPAAPSYVT